MTTSRRNFLKTAGVAAGAVSLSALPAWISDVVASEEAAANGVDKNALADIALSTARKLGVTYADIRINRYRSESSTLANSKCKTFLAVKISVLVCACYSKGRGASLRVVVLRLMMCVE